MAAKKKAKSEKVKKAIAKLAKNPKENVVSEGGLRCVMFKKSARAGGEKYSADDKKKHTACFKKKGTKDTATTYKHEPKTKHPGNIAGLMKACSRLQPRTKAADMLTPACMAIGAGVGSR